MTVTESVAWAPGVCIIPDEEETSIRTGAWTTLRVTLEDEVEEVPDAVSAYVVVAAGVTSIAPVGGCGVPLIVAPDAFRTDHESVASCPAAMVDGVTVNESTMTPGEPTETMTGSE
jgi:hypothetical protein